MRRTELAGLLQRTESVEVGSYLVASPQLATGMGTATKRIAGVTCLAAKNVDEPFLNRALGVGTIAPATAGLLERIERHYASIGKPSRIAVATGCVPLASLRALERRGYAPVEGDGELIYVYDRRTAPAMPQVAGLMIERAGPELASLYSKTGFESFKDRGPQFVAIVDALVRSRRRGLRAYLGRIDGEPAATGMLFDVRPVGGLGNGSVRPAFRGHGLQTAMIAHRIREGWARGYRIFFGQTVNPVSAHNMEDLGWRRLYVEHDWERAAPAPGGVAAGSKT
ncbi:MAG TPA: GNAT family N-acetyltransferase [Verrucomicrobiae bacterium]|nr:GNAT family N-acetyltransferase [Verrucomicrobiae bacterium]